MYRFFHGNLSKSKEYFKILMMSTLCIRTGTRCIKNFSTTRQNGQANDHFDALFIRMFSTTCAPTSYTLKEVSNFLSKLENRNDLVVPSMCIEFCDLTLGIAT